MVDQHFAERPMCEEDGERFHRGGSFEKPEAWELSGGRQATTQAARVRMLLVSD